MLQKLACTFMACVSGLCIGFYADDFLVGLGVTSGIVAICMAMIE